MQFTGVDQWQRPNIRSGDKWETDDHRINQGTVMQSMAVCNFMPDELFDAPKRRIVVPNVCLWHGLVAKGNVTTPASRDGVGLDIIFKGT